MASKWKDREFVKKYLKEYNSRPEVKARRKILGQNPKNKLKKQEYDKKYFNLPHVRERRKKYRRQWYLKNKEKILKQTREYKRINKERIIQHNKEYNQRREVKKRDNESRQIKKKENMQYNIKCKLRTRLWEVLKEYTKTGKIIPSKQYGINYKEIINHLKPFPKDIKKYDIDHILPLSKFDLTNLRQVKKAFAPENHAWLIKRANRSKGNKLVHPNYYKKHGYNPL